jgi:hypothetical protein
MGSGGALAKIQALIDQEGLRQFPRDKKILKMRWLLSVREAKNWATLSRKYEEILASEFECTREELDKFAEEDDATN